jgi:2-polyprenyl-3-methyl-5-hydroxy-6-metoxy-1,4-benzoquinol methylase
MFSRLRDFAFATAPGEWNIWQCQSCAAAYLDPRPSPSSIGRAYSHYYTQESTATAKHKTGAFGAVKSWLRSRIKNGYINRIYGHRLPAIPFGAAISGLRPKRRVRVDHMLRHLPAPKSLDSALLDVGCGNGDFVKLAASLDFRAVGIDPDESAISAARARGLDLRVGHFPRSRLPPGSFEHITANHVLEHLHEPKEAIREMYQLLQPGGRLWLSQPNLGAIGLKEFGAHWRGLEAPRHMTLLDSDGMRRLLGCCGFIDVSLLPPEPDAGFYYRQSLCQTLGLDPYSTPDPPGWGEDWERRVREVNALAEADPRVGESLTMIAWKSQT